jgi:anti-sigma B factor antagonist
MPLQIVQRGAEEVVILDLTGRLWILDLPLRDMINGLLASGKRYFVLNIAGVNYMDSSGLGQMVTIWTSVRGKSGHMTVLRPTKRVRRLFEITHLNTIFEILENEDDAVRLARTVSA